MFRRRVVSGVGFCVTGICLLSVLMSAAPADTRVPDVAGKGDKAALRALLKDGADVNAAQGDGMTALHWAAFNGDSEMTQLLLVAGANVTSKTRLANLTPLLLAAETGSAPVVASLVKAGSDVNAVNSAGMTPLMLAATAGAADAIDVLLKGGAKPNLKEKTHGQTALMFAAANDRAEAIAALLAGGADYKIATAVVQPPAPRGFGGGGGRGNRGQPPAPAAAAAAQQQNNNDDNPFIPPDPSGGMTPLLYAAREGRIQASRALLDGGADVNERSADKSTPLLVATINGHFDTAMFLLERGANPNLGSGAGATALYGAVNVQWAPKVFYPQPSTRLEKNSHIDLMKALLDRGADPNAKLLKDLWYTGYNGGGGSLAAAGATAFWRAAHSGDVDAMRLLVSRGANPGMTSANGVTPLLMAAGAAYFGTDEVVVPQGRMPAVRYLVDELHADVNAIDTRGGFSAVHHAAHRGDDDMILYLVSKGARVDIVAKNGQTTADMANGPRQRVQPYQETITLLMGLGASNSHKCVSC